MRLATLLLLLGLASCDWGAQTMMPAPDHYIGTVLEISTGTENGNTCNHLLFRKQDGTIVIFSTSGGMPVWKDFVGEILLEHDTACGYRMTSSKQRPVVFAQ